MAKKTPEINPDKAYGKVKKGKYKQKSIKQRIEALFLDNIGKVLTREQIVEVAKDPVTGKEPENWHQRLSELRTDDGYTILSWRNRGWLQVQEYLMTSADKGEESGKRVKPTNKTWSKVLKRAKDACEWTEGNQKCGLKEGEIDPILVAARRNLLPTIRIRIRSSPTRTRTTQSNGRRYADGIR